MPSFEIVDIADHALPHLDEPMPPRVGQYSRPHTRTWAGQERHHHARRASGTGRRTHFV